MFPVDRCHRLHRPYLDIPMENLQILDGNVPWGREYASNIPTDKQRKEGSPYDTDLSQELQLLDWD